MMVKFAGNFKCTIMSPNRLIFEKEVESVFLRGDQGEYELLAYHFPLIGVLEKGDIVINWSEKIPIQGGIVRFFANECTIMVEEVIEHLPIGERE